MRRGFVAVDDLAEPGAEDTGKPGRIFKAPSASWLPVSFGIVWSVMSRSKPSGSRSRRARASALSARAVTV